MRGEQAPIVKVDVCALMSKPQHYNGKMIQTRIRLAPDGYASARHCLGEIKIGGRVFPKLIWIVLVNEESRKSYGVDFNLSEKQLGELRGAERYVRERKGVLVRCLSSDSDWLIRDDRENFALRGWPGASWRRSRPNHSKRIFRLRDWDTRRAPSRKIVPRRVALALGIGCLVCRAH